MNGGNLVDLRLLAEEAWRESREILRTGDGLPVGVWQERVRQVLYKKVDDWKGKYGLTDRQAELIQPEALYNNVRDGRLWKLEAWRKKYPEIPYFMYCLRSAWQENYFSMVGSGDKLTDEETVMSLISQKVGKYLDRVYLRQMVLADSPFGSEALPHLCKSDSQGWQYLYEVKEEGKTVVYSYLEMFGEDMNKVIAGVREVADWLTGIKGGVAVTLFMNKLADLWSNNTHDPDELDKLWDEVLMMDARLGWLEIEVGNSATVAGDANKQDVELLIGIRDKGAETREQVCGLYLEKAKRWRTFVGESNEIKYSFGVNRLIAAFGVGSFGMTQAMGGIRMKEFYNVAEQLVGRKISILRKVMSIDGDVERSLGEAILGNLERHEVGHSIGDFVLKRKQLPARSTWANVLDELKSQMVGYLLAVADEKKMGVLAELAENSQVLVEEANNEESSSEPYNVMGRYIWAGLVDVGALRLDVERSKVILVDINNAYEWFEGQAKWILENIYKTGLGVAETREKAEVFVKKVKEAGQRDDVKMIVKWLKA